MLTCALPADQRIGFERLSSADQRRLTAAMATVREVSGHPAAAGYVSGRRCRETSAGVVRQHGAVYAERYRWERLVRGPSRQIVAGLRRSSTHAQREAAWIAEVNGEPAGCVVLRAKSDSTGQLRLLLVESCRPRHGQSARASSAESRLLRPPGRVRRADALDTTSGAASPASNEQQDSGLREETPPQLGRNLVGQTWRLP